MPLLRRKQKEPWQPESGLARQLAMTPQTWAALQENGVTEDTQLELDFFYLAESRDPGEELARFLRSETDYDVRVENDSVTGTTQPTTVSAAVLGQWVEWMVYAGATITHPALPDGEIKCNKPDVLDLIDLGYVRPTYGSNVLHLGVSGRPTLESARPPTHRVRP
jgi:hypothetical protein